MKIEFDQAKNAKNISDRGLSFTRVAEFDWTTAWIVRSDRRSEMRFIALGYLGLRLHVLVFSKQAATIRVISLRRANKREVKRYEETKS
jgi:uncharacterized DUF497 family protein